MQRCCNIWPLLCEVSHQNSVHYLDVRVSIDQSSQLICVTPEYKPTALKRILCSSSAHVTSVHKGWPLMMLRRLKFRCLHTDVGFHVGVLLDKFAEAGMDKRILCWLKSTLNSNGGVRRVASKGATVWCTLIILVGIVPYQKPSGS